MSIAKDKTGCITKHHVINHCERNQHLPSSDTHSTASGNLISSQGSNRKSALRATGGFVSLAIFSIIMNYHLLSIHIYVCICLIMIIHLYHYLFQIQFQYIVLLMLLMLLKRKSHFTALSTPADGYPRRSPAALPTDLTEPSWQLDLSWKTLERLDNYIYIYIYYIFTMDNQC